jgi:hypothetical protein
MRINQFCSVIGLIVISEWEYQTVLSLDPCATAPNDCRFLGCIKVKNNKFIFNTAEKLVITKVMAEN